ncbi:MAG: hypothetical protein P8Q98_04800, partial [Candidatus Poseidoniaceae archaeon]|nr:hypothetical protein [Candidatus Poseidoniaceae archaeon]
MNTVAILLGFMTLCVVLAVAVRVLRARRLRELLAARRAKYNLNFAERRRHVQTVRGRQVEDLDEEEISAYEQRDAARNQNIHFLRLLVADLFDEEELEPEQEEEQREEQVVARQSWIEEHQDGLDEHAALVEEEEIGSGVTVMAEIAPEEDDIEERLEREGGKGGEVQLSLAWDD